MCIREKKSVSRAGDYAQFHSCDKNLKKLFVHKFENQNLARQLVTSITFSSSSSLHQQQKEVTNTISFHALRSVFTKTKFAKFSIALQVD